MSPEIARHGRYKICVGAEGGERHSLPHAHIVQGKQRVASVFLLSLEIFLEHERLPRPVIDLIEAKQQELLNAWEELNP
jgi:hypothetical protein